MKHLFQLLLPLLLWIPARFRIRRKPARPQRIVLLAAGYLGDSFWAVQTARMLMDAFPGAQLFLVARSPFLSVLSSGILDPAHQIPVDSIVSDRTREHFSLSAFLRDIRRVHALAPDLVFDLINNRYSILFAFLTRSYTVGLDLDPRFSVLYSFRAAQARLPGPHLALRPRSIVRQFLAVPDSPSVALVPPAPRYSRAEIFAELKLKSDARPVLLIPGAGWSAKQWPPEQFHSLAQTLEQRGFTILVSGSPSETALCHAVADGLADPHILTGSLDHVVSLLPHCLLCLGGDTGVIHLAEAFAIPCLSLYCNTNPVFSRGLTPESDCLQSSCSLAPLPDSQYCQRGPLLFCPRTECMNFSPGLVLARLDALCKKE